MQNRSRQCSFIIVILFIVAPALGMHRTAGKKRPYTEEAATMHDSARQRTQNISKEEEFFQQSTNISSSFKTKTIFLTLTTKNTHEAGKLICYGYTRGFNLPEGFKWSLLLNTSKSLVITMTKKNP